MSNCNCRNPNCPSEFIARSFLDHINNVLKGNDFNAFNFLFIHMQILLSVFVDCGIDMEDARLLFKEAIQDAFNNMVKNDED